MMTERKDRRREGKERIMKNRNRRMENEVR